ncbi:MAG: glycosyltransferase family 4 protein [Magnetospirillum sp.]|nr:glycosyltransferase family 4 protein [Magnetospirillum sp.]
MRIAVIGTRGANPAHDGIQRALEEVCSRLARRGHVIDIFSVRNGRAIGNIDGARVIRLPTVPIGTGVSLPHTLLSSLVGSIRGYDIINFWAAESSGLFTLAAKLGLHRTVVSVHGLDGAPVRGLSLLSPDAVAARFADAITVVSRRLERHFRDTYGRETFYIPNGFSPPARPDADRLAQLGLLPGEYVLVADRLVPGSGVHDAIAAATASDGPLPLVIAETGDGDAEYREKVRNLAVPDRIVFLGQVSSEHLDALMTHAYLCLLPSVVDEPPAMLPRALAHGRAVLVSDQPEHLDMVGLDAFTFTSGDVGDLKRVLVWLLNDPQVVAQMERRAAAAATSRYCWDRIAEAYELVFTSVL